MTRVSSGAATLAAGAAKVEITPPLDVGLLMSSVEGKWAPFTAVRKPLFARTVVLEGTSPDQSLSPNQRAAVVSLDLLALSGKAFEGFESFKSRIVAAAGGVIAANEVILACTHTHTAPETAAITDLYKTGAFRAWSLSLADSIGRAIGTAAAAMAPCSLSYGTAMAPGLGIHRRIKTTVGIKLSHPEPPEEIVLSREGAVDDSVNVLWLSDRRAAPIAILVNATCHPVYEMCISEVSPDYPGALSSILESAYPGAMALFLNGAAGNINPRGVSAGADAAQCHAKHLHAAVEQAVASAKVETNPEVAIYRRTFEVPSRLPDGVDHGVTVSAEIAALRLGRTAIAFLPGEPFAETGNEIREKSPFELTAIVGFAEDTIGYIPTDCAFAEGGYEVGFGPWSYLGRGCEPIIREEALDSLREVATVHLHDTPP